MGKEFGCGFRGVALATVALTKHLPCMKFQLRPFGCISDATCTCTLGQVLSALALLAAITTPEPQRRLPPCLQLLGEQLDYVLLTRPQTSQAVMNFW